VSELQNTAQQWVYLATPPRGLPQLFPRRLVQIPEALRDEALAVVFRAATFRVACAGDIALLYGAAGEVGLAHLRAIELDWAATRDLVRLLSGGFMVHEDEAMEVALGLLTRFKGLKKLKVTLNGFAFMVAYARYRHRRVKAQTLLRPRLEEKSQRIAAADGPRVEVRMKGKHPLLCKDGPVYTFPEHGDPQPSNSIEASTFDGSTRSMVEFAGHTIKLMHVLERNDIHAGDALYGYANWHLHTVWMWKLDASGIWALPLRREIAQRDPLLVKLRESIGGLQELELCSPDGLGETFLLDFVFWMVEGLGTNALVDCDFLPDGLCMWRAHVKAGERNPLETELENDLDS